MKKLLAVVVVGIVLAVSGCTTEVVATRPSAVVYSRPVAPGPDYVWIGGDWVWEGGSYRWHEGRWDRRRPGNEWHEGHWEGHGKGYRWKKGHW